MQGYSKASQGLIVLESQNGLWTARIISQFSSLRQFPSRYFTHAGRQLNAKEFCYIITVIVTAVSRYSLVFNRKVKILGRQPWTKVTSNTLFITLLEVVFLLYRRSDLVIELGSTSSCFRVYQLDLPSSLETIQT